VTIREERLMLDVGFRGNDRHLRLLGLLRQTAGIGDLRAAAHDAEVIDFEHERMGHAWIGVVARS
jgi:hypothetical protein